MQKCRQEKDVKIKRQSSSHVHDFTSVSVTQNQPHTSDLCLPRAKRTVEPVLDDSDGDDSSAVTVDAEVQLPLPVESVLSEIAKDEIDEVDIIMEDITDEIEDLQQSINATGGEGATAGMPPPRRPVDLECRMTDSMQVGFLNLCIFHKLTAMLTWTKGP